jgi:hypothetical protein
LSGRRRRQGSTGWLAPALAALLIGPASAEVAAPQQPVRGQAGIIGQYVKHAANVALTPAATTNPDRASFGVRAPAQVTAGQGFTVQIVRSSHDGKSNYFALQMTPAVLLQDPPAQPIVIRIDDGQDSWSGQFTAVKDLPAGLPPRLNILVRPIKSEPLLDPRFAAVMIQPASSGSGDSGTTNEATNTTGDVTPANTTGGTKKKPDTQSRTTGATNTGGQDGFTTRNDGDGGHEPPAWVQLAKHSWPYGLGAVLICVIGWRLLRRPDPRPIRELHGDYSLRFGRSAFPGGEPRLSLPHVNAVLHIGMGRSTCPADLPMRGDA